MCLNLGWVERCGSVWVSRSESWVKTQSPLSYEVANPLLFEQDIGELELFLWNLSALYLWQPAALPLLALTWLTWMHRIMLTDQLNVRDDCYRMRALLSLVTAMTHDNGLGGNYSAQLTKACFSLLADDYWRCYQGKWEMLLIDFISSG